MKKFLCGLLSAAMAVSLTVPMAGAAYTDVPAESTLGGEVEKAVRYGLMNGYSDTTFGYGDSMTRAQFARRAGADDGLGDSHTRHGGLYRCAGEPHLVRRGGDRGRP